MNAVKRTLCGIFAAGMLVLGGACIDPAVRRTLETLEADCISISVGVSWRESGCDLRQQMEEADRLMYEEKARYHSAKEDDRRGKR